MANPSSAIDLHVSAEAYLAANAELYALKVNRLARWLPIDARSRVVAQWANVVDDFMLEAQTLLRLQRNGSGSPEGAVSADVGSLYLNTEASPTGSRLWVKATGSGTTGWEQVGGLEAHEATHRPGGSDALPTGTPVPVGSSLSEGSAASFARTDHVHTVDISVVSRTLYEVDYSTLANNTFADGTEVLDGLSYTSVNTALLGTAALVNGTGIDLRAGNSLGSGPTFNATTRNAYHLYLPLSSVPGWDGRYDYLIEIYASVHVLEINGDSFFVGLWGPAGQPTNGVERVKVARISNQGGTQQLGSTNNNTSTNGSNRGAENVVSTRISGKGEGVAMFGAWSSGWPAALQGDTNFTAETGVLSPLNHGGVRLVMGLGTSNDASATTRVLIERLRISR